MQRTVRCVVPCGREKTFTNTLKNHNQSPEKTDEEIAETVRAYGWTPETPKCFSNLIGIEIEGAYDGVSLWQCPGCDQQWSWFTKKACLPPEHTNKEDEEKRQ